LDKEGICRKAATAKHFYKVDVRPVRPSEKGVDRRNRDGIKLNARDVHFLATKICGPGCVLDEFAQSVAVLLRPSDRHKEIEWNQSVHSQPGFPEMTVARAQQIQMTTLVRSHANMVNRCYWYGVTCGGDGHEAHSLNGKMDMTYLEAKDPGWAAALRAGTATLILSADIRDREDLMDAISIADNLIGSANLVEHSLQLIARMARISRDVFSTTTNAVMARTRTLEQYRISRSHQGSIDDSEQIFNFVARISKHERLLAELESFRTFFLTDGSREVASSFLGACGSVQVDLNALRIALVKAQLTCPAQYMKNKICCMFSANDVLTLLPGRPLYPDALEADKLLVQARLLWQPYLAMLTETNRDAVLAKMDCLVVRCLFKRESKEVCLQSAMVSSHEHLVNVMAKTLPDVAPPSCPWKRPTTAEPKAATPKQAEPKAAAHAALTEFLADGSVSADTAVRDAGFAERSWVEVANDRPLADPQLPKASKWQIIEITPTHIRIQTRLGQEPYYTALQHSTAQHSTAQHSTAQYSTVLYSIALQYDAMRCVCCAL
jgi:hypothetical protein